MSTKVEVVSLPKRSSTTQSEVAVTLPSGTGWTATAALPYSDEQGPALAVVFDNAVAAGRSSYGFTGAGDQVNLTDTSAHVFTKKATVPADVMAVDDFCEWEAEVYVDGTNATPSFTVKLLLGTAELDSIAMTTITTADYCVIRGNGKVTGATTMRMYKGQGEVKDTTLALSTHAAPADVTIQAMSAARDVTCSVTSDAGHASNLATLKNLRFTVLKANV